MFKKFRLSEIARMENIPTPPKSYHIRIMYELLSDVEKWDNEQEYKLRNYVLNSLSEYIEVLKCKNDSEIDFCQRYQNDTCDNLR